ncbi:hypothetical protein IJJ18_02085 [Candidatus Saccharibacteria bacterium]|nr:hypothetical protein [Candidatus Saccharibacteria bacterium]
MHDKTKIKQLAIIAAIFASLVAIVSAVFVFLKGGLGEDPAMVPGYEETWDNLVSFENGFQLDYSLAAYGSGLATSQIETALTKESEIATAPNRLDETALTIATIVDGTFAMISENPEIYSFDLSTDDGRNYKVWILVRRDVEGESVEFLSTIVKRANSDEIIVLASSEDEGDLSIVRDWLKNNQMAENIKIETVEPEEDYYDTLDDGTEASSYAEED